MIKKAKISLIGMALAILSTEVSANSIACPDASQIKEIQSGSFRACVDGVEWLGSLQGLVKEHTSLKSFDKALVIQENEDQPQKFQHCSYRVEGGNLLDMRFIPKSGETNKVQIEGEAWKKEEGPFGLIYHVCEETTPDNCRFNVAGD